MQPADYRLVRSQITAATMMPIKRSVFPRTIDQYFSSWLYGERKSTVEIPVHLSRPDRCCQDRHDEDEDFSLLTVDVRLFRQCLPTFSEEQLFILHSLLDGDRQIFERTIHEQYRHYREMLIHFLFK